MTFLGVDCGTSALKAALVDDRERVIAMATRAYSPDRPKPSWSEQNPEIWRAAMFAALAELRAAAPEPWRAVRAIGFSGQMHGLIALGPDDQPLRPAILHNDGRAHAEAAELHANHGALEPVVGVKAMGSFPAAKMLWLQRNEPDLHARIACVLAPKDWLRFALTGEKATDMSDAAGAWWLDEAARAWSKPALAASATLLNQVPALLEGAAQAGRLRADVAAELGLSREVVVAAGGGDAAVGAVALGVVRPGAGFISLGTACQWVVASDVYRAAPERLVHSFAHALPGRWYRMAAMLNGAGALAFAGRLLRAEVAELEAEAAAGYRGPADLFFLPYLSGERTPHDDPYARGVAFGLAEAHTRVDLTRAVMEGVAFTLVDARDCLAETGDLGDRVGIIGGGAKSGLWARMIASACGVEVIRYRGGEAGPAFGAARLARLAATGEAADDVCRPPETLDATEPEPELADAFGSRRERFQALYRALRPEFAKAAAK
jgi:xylulokinase